MKFLRNNSCQGEGGFDWEEIVLDENKLDKCSNRKQNATNMRYPSDLGLVYVMPLLLFYVFFKYQLKKIQLVAFLKKFLVLMLVMEGGVALFTFSNSQH